MKRRRSLTLLEVIIALSLAAILLGTLMAFFRQAAKQKIEIQELKKTVLPIEVTRQRLIHLFAHLQSDKKDLSLFAHPQAKGEALRFTYENGTDQDPDFCGAITGMLYLNERHQLCLVSWGHSHNGREEILMDHLESLSFTFFDPKEKKWKSTWKNKDSLPPMLKVSWHLFKEKESTECIFFFSEAQAPILYPGGTP